MKLNELLVELPEEDLLRIGHDVAHVEETLGGAQLRDTIEGVLKSHRFLQDFVFNRQPPSFAILTLLLEADDYTVPFDGFASAVQAETTRICVAVDAGLIVGRDDHLRVYRRVLHQARGNDYKIDEVEGAILTVLRQELFISQAEHFLIEHHADLREFWRTAELFEREFKALKAAGLIFLREGMVLIPDDQAANLRRVLGIDMSRADATRLYGYLGNSELHDCLAALGLPTSGNKDDRVARLIMNMVQPHSILMLREVIGIDRLKELCREMGAAVSGSKEDLVTRIINFISADRDIEEEIGTPERAREQHRLDREAFGRLFALLRAHDLTSLLIEFDLKRSGTKEVQIETLWDAELSEVTLLSSLNSGDIETVLRRIELKPHGSKPDRIERLISHFEADTGQLETSTGTRETRDAKGPFEPVA